MTRVLPLLRLELQRLARAPVIWIVLALLFAAMLVAAMTGVARVRADEATLARIATEERQSVARAQATTRRWSTLGDLVVPVFRDPTDAYSYFYNFMTVHAVRPPAPLAAVAAGQSDLQPAYIRLNMSAVFPDTAYELRSPRILALGAFDLGFVIVYMLPLALIALVGTSLTREQDSGVLRLIAAQPIALRTVAAARFGAQLVLLVPVVTASAVAALLLTSAIGAGASPAGMAVLVALIALYAAFWIVLSALVASFWRGGVQALAALMLAWAAMTLLVPAVGALLVEAAYPAPSRLAYLDHSRALADEVPGSWEDEKGASRWLASRPDLRAAPDAARSAEAGRLARDVFFRDELASERTAFDTHGRAVDHAGNLVRLLSPASLLDCALQSLAGTDMAAQTKFIAAADTHAQVLRRHFEPIIVSNIGRARSCPTCPGRLNYAGYDAVPTFNPAPQSRLGLERGVLTVGYLIAVTLVLALWGNRRFRDWPV